MITRITHSCIFVHDQNEALRFYRDILGMEVRADFDQAGFRWLTVGPKGQPDFELVLLTAQASQALPEETALAIQALLKTGYISAGIFLSDDVMRDYEAWSKQGVEFPEPPVLQYGTISARVMDFSGNWFRLMQNKN
jgi:catechol 2,3-dioxygenase-like lactoylglutathione lyase family enzyme